MKKHLLVIVLCFCSIQMFYSQEDTGVVALNVPLRNSLTFNRFNINPAFSFVREQNKYISVSNKREWAQFENAPLTYFASYSGRFGENIGAGLGVFQQNYGVLTTFGGLLNFAYNVRLARDSNLTFGLNIGAYKSGLNTGNVIVNFDDPALQNVPENFLITANPGINYGNGYFDFGLSIKNLVAYNLESSAMLEDNPEQGIQAHLMYTGYMNSRGFFDESKFTGLVKSEFRKNETIISAMTMLTIPKGIWAQVGYNTVYGVSGGAGINITPQIAIEYNFEKGIGDLTNFGPSHEFSLAYRFKNNNNYEYSSGDEISGLLSSDKKKRRKKVSKPVVDRKAIAEQKAQQEADAQAKLLADQKAQQETDAQAKLLAEQKAQQEADAQVKLLAEQKAQQEVDAQAKLLDEQKAQQEADAQAKLLDEQKAQQEADAQAKLLAEQKAQQEADAQAKLLAEQKAKQEADAQAKLLAEQKAKDELILNPTDDLGKAMLALTKQTEESKTTQSELLERFDNIIGVKDEDLKSLKEENDLSEQGIALDGPKPFKSITEENNRLAAIKSDLDNVIETRNEKIKELKSLYDDKVETDTVNIDEVDLYYRKTLERLSLEQKEAIEAKTKLETRLDEIQVATEFERRRRIKRAAFDNEEERYTQDRAALQNIKKTTAESSEEIKSEDFDFGEKQSDNIQILKNVKNVDNGCYLVIAIHNDKEKRNDFVTKVIQSGSTNIDFFYDVNTSKYFIYTEKYDSVDEANRALKSKGDKPYNINMSIVKIEN